MSRAEPFAVINVKLTCLRWNKHRLGPDTRYPIAATWLDVETRRF